MSLTLAQKDQLLALIAAAEYVPGYSKCYVTGCYQDSLVSRLHKIYGPVDCCADHDPEKHGYALGFGQPAPVVPEALETPEAEKPLTNDEMIAIALKGLLKLAGDNNTEPDGGKKAKLIKPRKPLSPQGMRIPDPNATVSDHRF